ncbi:hypothetical protein RRG08_003473 [Elysia crispata]|uniref:Uncharacterized protein n=1 Tax=Elysia crispata TaxID=231223 RepID=A0AAE0Y7B6_9GAST|nr:hypothetical protein RRG08_003473 [Elysia crispata]
MVDLSRSRHGLKRPVSITPPGCKQLGARRAARQHRTEKKGDVIFMYTLGLGGKKMNALALVYGSVLSIRSTVTFLLEPSALYATNSTGNSISQTPPSPPESQLAGLVSASPLQQLRHRAHRPTHS